MTIGKIVASGLAGLAMIASAATASSPNKPTTKVTYVGHIFGVDNDGDGHIKLTTSRCKIIDDVAEVDSTKTFELPYDKVTLDALRENIYNDIHLRLSSDYIIKAIVKIDRDQIVKFDYDHKCGGCTY